MPEDEKFDLYALSAPCGLRRHKFITTLLLEANSIGQVQLRVCPICGARWSDAELTEMHHEIMAIRSNQRDYKYPKGARGHFTGD